MGAFQKAVVKAGTPFSMRQVFSCEVNKAKQTWINNLVNKGKTPGDVCIFADAQDMGGHTARCIVHNMESVVEPVDLLIVGTSCKDMSRVNSNMKKVKDAPVLSKKTTPGRVGQPLTCCRTGLSLVGRSHLPAPSRVPNHDLA